VKVAAPVLIKNRYEVKDELGRGGMGVVYRAFDQRMRREVAVKTLRGAAGDDSTDWFQRECGVLAGMVHPNIVEIFDMGEFEEDGVLKPYFVMPLLPGRTLYDLIYRAGTPLPPERCADIISQACRGLQAAHESGLLHRDIKPHNIFVMRDDAVKLIDFGVVRLLGGHMSGTSGLLGTLQYMAPEQIQMKPLTARSDIFALATVCYEALTGVHPFVHQHEAETAEAVLHHVPVLSCVLNPLVSRPLAQAVAQGMAKDPRTRFESAAAFADALQQGLRNERPNAALPTNPQNRVARAQRSFARGDYEFAREILDELEAEGWGDAEVHQLRMRLDETVRKRQSEVDLATARRYFEKEEYALALRRVSEIVDGSPPNRAALSLKSEIEDKIEESQIAESLERAIRQLDSGAFSESRRIIEDALSLRPGNSEAQRLLEETERKALDWPRQRQEQETLFEAAQSAYVEGQLDTSLQYLEQLAELARQSKAAGARVTEYQDFYKRVRGDYEALQATLADARKFLDNGDLDAASLLDERLRKEYPQNLDVDALSNDVEARRRERAEDYRRGVERRVAHEADLAMQLQILTEAVHSRPNDDYFHQQRQKVEAKLWQVVEVVERAQSYESAAQLDYALEEWLCVRDIYPAFAGLREHLARVKALWEAAREKTKATLNAEVGEALWQGAYERAAGLLEGVRVDLEDDADYRRLTAAVEAAAKVPQQVWSLLSRIQVAEHEGRLTDIPALCQEAADLSEDIEPLRQGTFAELSATATRLTKLNWRAAQQILRQAARLGTVPAALEEGVAKQERAEEVETALGAERGSAAKLGAFRERIATLLKKYPDETRLEQRLSLIDAALTEQHKQDKRRICEGELALLDQELGDAKDHSRLWETQRRAKTVAAPFAGDPEIEHLLANISRQVSLFEESAEALSRDRIQDCFAICDQVLAVHPGHYLFRMLKDRAHIRHRELGEDYLARVERWLASEPDFKKREEILKKAQAEYPFETRYADELQDLQRGKALTELLEAKARAFENSGQMAEALAEWRELGNIHPAYSDLEERVANCEMAIDRQQRRVTVQRLLSKGQSQLAAGEFTQGYQALHEAWALSQDIEDQLRPAAPDLIAAARALLPANLKLAEAMTVLAQSLNGGLPIPEELRIQISKAREAEELSRCLAAMQALQEGADPTGAGAVADEFLAEFPGVKQVESLRGRIWTEIEKERKLQARALALDEPQRTENEEPNFSPPELLDLKKSVNESVSEAALAEAAVQKAEIAAKYLEEVQQHLAGESDFSKQAAILREALAQHPGERSLIDESTALNAKQEKLDGQIKKVRELEGEQLFGEAIKEWEVIRQAYPWYPDVDAEVERLANARRKERQDALERWFRQAEQAIHSCDYETASAMIRQAQQQQGDRKLQGLEEKLEAGLKQKETSDVQFAEGKRLLLEGAFVRGAQALTRAHELQPGDKERSEAITALLMAGIRASIATDFAACEELLAHLKRISPSQTLPPDVSEAISNGQQAAEAESLNLHRMQEQLARLTNRAEGARSKKSLSSVANKLQISGLLNSRDVEVQRAAKQLLGKIKIRLSGFETALIRTNPKVSAHRRRWSNAGVAVGVLVVLAGAVAVFFLSRSYPSGVPVQISVQPDHATIEIEGHTCITPDCNLILKPGEYVINLRKAGYKQRSVRITVKPGDSTPLNLKAALEPVAIPISDLSPRDSK
jgi:serine/threonine protein kinase